MVIRINRVFDSRVIKANDISVILGLLGLIGHLILGLIEHLVLGLSALIGHLILGLLGLLG